MRKILEKKQIHFVFINVIIATRTKDFMPPVLLSFSSKDYFSSLIMQMILGIFLAAVGYLVTVRLLRSVVGSPKKTVSDALKTVVC